MNFIQFLEQRVAATNSLLCVGLDPRSESADALYADCVRLIDATAPYAACYKPNSAFFEAHGAAGIAALRAVIAHVPTGIPVLLDAKRGDIADTAEAYASAAFDHLGAHAVTVNPYLGGEALAPFLARPERGAFVLCKTSNPGADEFQALELATPLSTIGRGAGGEGTLYETVARQAQSWNRNGNVALVVGATDPEALARVRAAAPDLWFLVPGVGAQGGDLAAALRTGLRADGQGVLITTSRAIARAADPAAAAEQFRDEINTLRTQSSPLQSSIFNLPLQQLAQDLITSQCVRFGQFTLKSGALSPIYLDLRRLVTYPAILRRVARAYAAKLSGLHFDRLAGLPYAALPIATAIALEMDRPMIYPRREAKEYGTKASIEGEFNPGETAVMIDDLVTTGGAKFEAIEKLEGAGLTVRDIVVLIDRGQGASATLAEAGYTLHAVATLPELLPEWQRTGAISLAQAEEVRAFLAQ